MPLSVQTKTFYPVMKLCTSYHIIPGAKKTKCDGIYNGGCKHSLKESFVETIASDLLHRKGLSAEEYCENIVKPQWPLDEIGLVVFARL